MNALTAELFEKTIANTRFSVLSKIEIARLADYAEMEVRHHRTQTRSSDYSLLYLFVLFVKSAFSSSLLARRKSYRVDYTVNVDLKRGREM